jgi:fucose permease
MTPLPSRPAGSAGRQLAFLAACCAMLVFALSAAILPAALLRAAVDLQVATAVLTRVVATQFGAFFISTLVGGLLSERVGKRTILQGGCLLTTAGAGCWTVVDGLAGAHAAAALLGLGGGILESLGSALLADLYPERRKFVLNVTQIAYCAGAASGPAVMAVLLPLGVSWRLFFAGESLLGLVLLLLYRWSPAPRAAGGGQAGLGDMVRPLRDPVVRLLALALFGYVLSESGLVVGAATYLQVRHQAPEQWAILAITLVWVGMLVGRVLCAALPERLPTGRLVGGLALAGAIALGAQGIVTRWTVSLALFVLAGFAFSGIWPLIVALGVTRQPERSGAAAGVIIATGSLGVVAAPLLISALIGGPVAVLLYPLFAGALLLAAALVYRA